MLTFKTSCCSQENELFSFAWNELLRWHWFISFAIKSELCNRYRQQSKNEYAKFPWRGFQKKRENGSTEDGQTEKISFAGLLSLGSMPMLIIVDEEPTEIHIW